MVVAAAISATIVSSVWGVVMPIAMRGWDAIRRA